MKGMWMTRERERASVPHAVPLSHSPTFPRLTYSARLSPLYGRRLTVPRGVSRMKGGEQASREGRLDDPRQRRKVNRS